jgi:hypothetical protein
VMGFLYLLSLLVLLLVTSFGQICCSEAKSETHHWFVEGNKTSGKSSNIVTSLFSVYNNNPLTY